MGAPPRPPGLGPAGGPGCPSKPAGISCARFLFFIVLNVYDTLNIT